MNVTLITIFDFDTIAKGEKYLKFSEMSMNKCLTVELICYQSTANHPWASDSEIAKSTVCFECNFNGRKKLLKTSEKC